MPFQHDEHIAKLRILVVEPFSQLREILRDILLCGIGVGEVHEARNGEDALKMLRDLSCDLAIVDAGVEPMGGVELIRKIRTGDGNVDPYTPVIVMSGNARLGEIIAARDVGANDYVAKPLSAKILDLRLHALVERPRPFIRSDNFFGPDRRRHHKLFFQGQERRIQDTGDTA